MRLLSSYYRKLRCRLSQAGEADIGIAIEKIKPRGNINIKSNLHYTRGITTKRVKSGEAHPCGIALGQHSSEKTS